MLFTWFKTISSLLIELYRQVNFLSNCDTALSKLFCGRVICLPSIVAYMLSLCFLSVSYLVDGHAFSCCGYPYPWFNSCLCQLCSGPGICPRSTPSHPGSTGRDSYPVQALLNKLLREFIHGWKLSDREDMLENAFHSHKSNDVHIQRALVL